MVAAALGTGNPLLRDGQSVSRRRQVARRDALDVSQECGGSVRGGMVRAEWPVFRTGQGHGGNTKGRSWLSRIGAGSEFSPNVRPIA